jgi:hypothetical protein
MNSAEYVKTRPLCEALFWFIENVDESDPERSETFFALRERVRAEGPTHDAAPAMLAAARDVLAALPEFERAGHDAFVALRAAIDSAEGR